MKKLIIIGSTAAFISGLVLHVIIPAALQFVISALLSAATILDPLHAKGRVETFWTAFFVILLLQFIYTVFIALSVGTSSVFLSQKIRSGWFYPASAFLSLIIHYILLFLFAVGCLILADKDTVIGFLILFSGLITITAPIIGLICAVFVKKHKAK